MTTATINGEKTEAQPGYLAKMAEDHGAERMRLLADTIGRDLTPSELAYFVEVAKLKGLDPFSRQIYAIKRYDKRLGRDVMTIQQGIDGFRSSAESSGKYAGQEGPWWCGEDGQWREVWVSEAPPVASKILVYRRDFVKPIAGVAHFREYAQTFRDGNLMGLWGSHPCVMVSKCAESIALRRAFPDQLSGVYSPDEMPIEDTKTMSEETRTAYVSAMEEGIPPGEAPKGWEESTVSATPPPGIFAGVEASEAIEAEIIEVKSAPKKTEKPKAKKKKPSKSASQILLEFADAADAVDAVEDLAALEERWSEELSTLRRGRDIAEAWLDRRSIILTGRSVEENLSDGAIKKCAALEDMRKNKNGGA